MREQIENIDIVLIGEDARRLALLRQEISNRANHCRIRTLDAAQVALTPSGRSRRGDIDNADIVCVDFAGPETARLSLIRALAFGAKRTRTPVVIMTSEGSEELLRQSAGDTPDLTMFSPTTLSRFLRGLLEKQRRRFMRSLSTLYEFGPVLVRLPDSADSGSERDAVLSA